MAQTAVHGFVVAHQGAIRLGVISGGSDLLNPKNFTDLPKETGSEIGSTIGRKP
jgi:hypothetical protein